MRMSVENATRLWYYPVKAAAWVRIFSSITKQVVKKKRKQIIMSPLSRYSQENPFLVMRPRHV